MTEKKNPSEKKRKSTKKDPTKYLNEHLIDIDSGDEDESPLNESVNSGKTF
jgi:hypothetical protein